MCRSQAHSKSGDHHPHLWSRNQDCLQYGEVGASQCSLIFSLLPSPVSLIFAPRSALFFWYWWWLPISHRQLCWVSDPSRERKSSLLGTGRTSKSWFEPLLVIPPLQYSAIFIPLPLSRGIWWGGVGWVPPRAQTCYSLGIRSEGNYLNWESLSCTTRDGSQN